jgi:trimeric autotransporter adhesin
MFASVVVIASVLCTQHMRQEFRCDGCNGFPMRDMRYQCTVCPDYDLCATCHNTCHSADAAVRASYSAFNPSTHSWEHPTTAIPISPRGDDTAAASAAAVATASSSSSSSTSNDSTALPEDALQKLCAELYPLLVEQLPKVVSSSSSTAAIAASSANSAAQQQASAASSAQYLVLLVKLAVGGSSSAAAARVPALVRLLVAQLRAAATALLESTDSAPAQLTARRPQVEAAALLAQTLRHVLAWLMTAGSGSNVSKGDKSSDTAAGTAATTAAGDTAAGSSATAGGSSAADAMDIDSTEDDAFPVLNSGTSASDMPSLASVHSEVLAYVLGGYVDSSSSSSSSSKKSSKRQYGKGATAATTAAAAPPLEAVLCGLLGRVLEALNSDKSGVSAASASSSTAAAAVREAAQGGLLLRVSCDPNGEAAGTPLPVMAGTMTQLLMGDANLARGLPAVVKVH